MRRTPRWAGTRRAVAVVGAGLLLGSLAVAAPAVAVGRPTASAATQMGPGDHTVIVHVGGLTRSLLLHVPPNPPAAHRPILLVFHGHGDTAQSTAAGTDFEQVADRTGEVVAFLQGVNDAWNEQAFPGDTGRPNDVAFTAAAIAVLEKDVSFDHRRIVAVGFSNGALMVEDLGCKLARSLAMVVPVEGQLAVSTSKSCRPARPISVYEVHGTADTAIPYDGGGSHGPVVLSAPKSVARWAQLDHCTVGPRSTSVSQSVQLSTYSRCRGSRVTVVLRTLVGGVHQWGSNIGSVVHGALAHLPA